MHPVQEAYAQLVAKVDAFFGRVQQRYPADLACRSGCAGCCGHHLSLSGIEAGVIRRGLAALDDSADPQVPRADTETVSGADSEPLGSASDEPRGPCVLILLGGAVNEHLDLFKRHQPAADHLVQMRPQLPHDGEAAGDLLVGDGQLDGGHGKKESEVRKKESEVRSQKSEWRAGTETLRLPPRAIRVRDF